MAKSLREVQEKDKKSTLLAKKSQQLTETIDALLRNEKKLETSLKGAVHTADDLKERVNNLTIADKNHKRVEEERVVEISRLRNELEALRLKDREKDQNLERVKEHSQRLASVENMVSTLKEEKAILLDR